MEENAGDPGPSTMRRSLSSVSRRNAEASESTVDSRSTLLRTPSQSSFTSKKARLAGRNINLVPSLSQHDLPLHSRSLDTDDPFGPPALLGNMPKLVRQTTYSSLPPSPRITAAFDFGITVDGVHPDQLEHALDGVTRPSSNSSDDAEWIPEKLQLQLDEEGGMLDEVVSEVDEVDEVFWPARSRRHTLEHVVNGPMAFPPRISRRRTSLSVVGEKGKGRKGHKDEYVEPVPNSPIEPTSSGDEKVGSLHVESKGERMGIAASLWDILKDEGGEELWEGWVADGKWERIANFLAVPLAVEKITIFGALLCLDGFLYNFTVLPIRAVFAFYRSLPKVFSNQSSIEPSTECIPPSHLHSMLRLLLLIIPTGILLASTDSSKMYHTVRGQDTIKLYVIFNALEIADRLCGAFGQDVLDTLFARETLAPTHRKRGKGRKRQQARPLFFFMLSLGYVLAHTLIFFYMLVSLNVAINSYDYTLLSLLISNQFVEIKGSVFKKFEKENLFQIMCADIVERFQLSLMLTVIAIRNTIEMAGSDIAFLPKSFVRGKSLINSIFSPVVFVIVSEMLVDWLKHAFITKFNHVRASVYGRFTDVLAKDVLVAGSVGRDGRSSRRGQHPVFLDQSPLVARRLGFASIPCACLVLRVGVQAVGMLTMSTRQHDESTMTNSYNWAWITFKWIAIIGVGLSAWGCLVAFKILLGLSLLSYSAVRQEGMEQREAEDAVNDFGRAPVGESKEETDYNKQTKVYLNQVEDDLDVAVSPSRPDQEPDGGYPTPRPDSAAVFASEPQTISTTKGTSEGKGGKRGKKWKLEEVERWTMVKRIW